MDTYKQKFVASKQNSGEESSILTPMVKLFQNNVFGTDVISQLG
jgi:hypothetical protein